MSGPGGLGGERGPLAGASPLILSRRGALFSFDVALGEDPRGAWSETRLVLAGSAAVLSGLGGRPLPAAQRSPLDLAAYRAARAVAREVLATAVAEPEDELAQRSWVLGVALGGRSLRVSDHQLQAYEALRDLHAEHLDAAFVERTEARLRSRLAMWDRYRQQGFFRGP